MTKRNTGIDLFRIIIMYGIVLMHLLVHSRLLEIVGDRRTVVCLYEFMRIFVGYGINMLFMITGYYMYDHHIHMKKVLKFECMFYFYALLGGVVLFFHVEVIQLIKVITGIMFPVLTSQWWFATNYIVLYLCIPVLNHILSKMNKKQHIILLFVLVILFSIAPKFFFWSSIFGGVAANSLYWTVALYMIGAYIGKYGCHIAKKRQWISLVLVTAFFVFVSMMFRQQRLIDSFVHGYNSVFMLYGGVLLFICAKTLSIRGRAEKIVNIFSQLVFGVYLFHDNPFVRERLWNFVVRECWISNKDIWIVVEVIVIASGVFLVGMVIEGLRRLLFAKAEQKFIDKVDTVLAKRMRNFCGEDCAKK